MDTKLKRRVALKKLTRAFDTSELAKRSYRELRILKHMKHENVSLCVCVFHILTVCVWMRAYVCVCACVRMCVSTHACVRMWCVCVCMCVCACTCSELTQLV